MNDVIAGIERCPFCGGEAIQRGGYIECGECSAQGPTDREPKTGWNTRALRAADALSPATEVRREAIDRAIGIFLDDTDWLRSGLGIEDKRRRMALALPCADEAAIRADQREIDAKIAEHNDRQGEWPKSVDVSKTSPTRLMQTAVAQAIRNGGKQP